jgi:hypothetical protein
MKNSLQDLIFLEFCDVNPLCERILWSKNALTVFNTETAYSIYYLTPLKRIISMNVMLDKIEKELKNK